MQAFPKAQFSTSQAEISSYYSDKKTWINSAYARASLEIRRAGASYLLIRLWREREVSHLLEVAGGGGDDVAEGQVRERRLHRVRIHLRCLLLMLLLAPASPSSSSSAAAAAPARRICSGFVGKKSGAK